MPSRDRSVLVFVWGWGFVLTLVKVTVYRHVYVNINIIYVNIGVSFKMIFWTSGSNLRLGISTLAFTGSSCISLI